MADEQYPIIEPDGEELFFQNAWRTDLPQTLGETECFDFNAQPNVGENLVIMKLTGQQLTEMLSALYIGAEFTYPEKYLEIIRPLLAATACPPILEEQECYEYPTYASFLRYAPMNPYIEPNTIPDGYVTQPFLVNGENGNNIPNYEHFDVIVPFDAITFDLNFFEDIAGQLPTIEVVVQGSGKAFLKMLTIGQGGLAVITLDNPPNLIDILAGIVTGSENIIDLNQDLVSLPPETAQELIFEVDVAGSGIHTIYIVFLPILDDSLVPLRFGGGFRGVQLCDFVPQGDSGVQNLRFLNCNLEQQNADGLWTIVDGWENWLDCVPSGGGGGGSAIVSAIVYVMSIAANFATGSATFVDTGFSVSHNFTKSKALIHIDAAQIDNSTTNNSYVQARLDGLAPSGMGSSESVGRNQGVDRRETACSAVFIDITPGVHEIGLYARSGGATATVRGTGDANVVIVEFDDASQLFVEDIRIQGNEIQKKIGGVWLTVSESLASILAGITAIANNAASAASAAQSTANNALNVANGAVTINNQQNVRLNEIEDDIDDINLSLGQINLTLENHETRLDTLEAIDFSGQEFWSSEWNFLASSNEWTSSLGTWVSGQGWVQNGGTTMTFVGTSQQVFDGRISHIQIKFRKVSGGFGTLTLQVAGEDSFSVGQLSGSNNLNTDWFRISNQQSVPQDLSFVLSNFSFELRIESIKVLGRGAQLWS